MSITPNLTHSDLLTDAYRHYRKLLARAINLTHDKGRAEDLVHDTFIKAYRSQRHYADQGNIEGWLMTILRNLHIDMTRRARFRKSAHMDYYVHADYNAGPAKMMMDDARTAIQNLPPELRKVMELYIYEDEKYEDIALKYGLPLGTLKFRIHRARKIMASGPLREYAATIEGAKKLKKFSASSKQ